MGNVSASYAPHSEVTYEDQTSDVGRTESLDAALAYARQGFSVFPIYEITDGRCTCDKKDDCNNIGKHPRTRHGFKDATTDEAIVQRWWESWPDANIGIRTGAPSGLFVIDVDPRNGGDNALEEATRRHGPLPQTLEARTGSSGKHLIFRHPGVPVRCSAGNLGPGLDVKGDGGYIVAAPSIHVSGARYQWANQASIAGAPEWLLKAVRGRSKTQSGNDSTSSIRTRPASLDGGLIPDGERNSTLFRMGCALRAREHDQPAIEEALKGVNAERCTPPLDLAEVRNIAASASRYPAGDASLSPTPEVLKALGKLETEMWRPRWKGKAGLSDRDVYVALLNAARRYGRMIPAGVRVSISVRDLALAASVSKATASNAVNRLMVAGLIRRDGRGTGTECGAFVLVVRDEIGHSSTELVPFSNVPVGRAPRLRWRGLGKTPGAILDTLDAYGPSTLRDLAGYLGKNRPRDLRPHLNYLLEAAVVECDDDMYRLADDYRQALDEERRLRGELEAERRDRARYDLEREVYREEFERRKRGEKSDRTAKPVTTGASVPRLWKLRRLGIGVETANGRTER
jgi:DNA-binding transcriptional ArsR family regulator